MITQNMKEIYKLLGNDAVFISITIDPGRDKPEVLKEYKFLTGKPEILDSLLKLT